MNRTRLLTRVTRPVSSAVGFGVNVANAGINAAKGVIHSVGTGARRVVNSLGRRGNAAIYGLVAKGGATRKNRMNRMASRKNRMASRKNRKASRKNRKASRKNRK